MIALYPRPCVHVRIFEKSKKSAFAKSKLQSQVSRNEKSKAAFVKVSESRVRSRRESRKSESPFSRNEKPKA